MTKVALIAGAVIALSIVALILVLKSKTKKIKDLEADVNAKDEKIAEQAQQLAHAKSDVQEVADVQQKIKTAKEETIKPQTTKMPVSGDFSSRVDRFNSL